jgi:hypothetical protein
MVPPFSFANAKRMAVPSRGIGVSLGACTRDEGWCKVRDRFDILFREYSFLILENSHGHQEA